MPPSPEQIPIPAICAPRDNAVLASSDNAPKLMSKTNRNRFIQGLCNVWAWQQMAQAINLPVPFEEQSERIFWA